MGVYLDWAKLSRPSTRVRNRVNEFRKIRNKSIGTLEKELRNMLAERMNVKAERVGLAYNTTEAAECVSRLLELDRYTRLVSRPDEYQSILNIFLREDYREANRMFVTYHDISHTPKNGGIDNGVRYRIPWTIQDFDSEIEPDIDPGSLILMSGISRRTGAARNLRLLNTIKDSFPETPILIDGAQYLELPDLYDVKHDGFVGCLHKHLGGIPALGFFYIPENSIKMVDTEEIRWEQTMTALYGPAIVGALEALEERKHGLKKVIELSGKVKEKISKAGGVLSQKKGEIYPGHIVTFHIPDVDNEKIWKELTARDIKITYLRETDELRISINPLNTKQDIEIFGDALREISILQ